MVYGPDRVSNGSDEGIEWKESTLSSCLPASVLLIPTKLGKSFPERH